MGILAGVEAYSSELLLNGIVIQKLEYNRSVVHTCRDVFMSMRTCSPVPNSGMVSGFLQKEVEIYMDLILFSWWEIYVHNF